MRSLRSRLLVLWALSLAASLAVGGVLVQLYRQSSAAQSGLGAASLEQACAAIAENYSYYVAGWAGPRQIREDAGFRRDLAAVVGLAMTGRVGLEAGIWLAEGEGLALAQPPPETWRGPVARAAALAAQEDEPVPFEGAEEAAGVRRGLACPLEGPVDGLVAWVLRPVDAVLGYPELRVGLGLLMALVLVTALWLSTLLLAWSRRIEAIEVALGRHEGRGGLPTLPPTGERELDRIVAALNGAGSRLAEAQARSAALSARVAAAERLAALGRVAAGVAHEIRNPIAAMRLRAENALAGDPAGERGRAALEAILGQVARLDRLAGELLTMTQRRDVVLGDVDVGALLRGCAAEHDGGGVRLVVDAPALVGRLDAGLVRRILDNLLENALRHTPAGGIVRLSAGLADGRLRVEVADTGPGVDPALRDGLFEPFVTGRPDGTGLGLAIARELAEAHGGTLVLADSAEGARFVLEVPWPAS